jgi:hypothetical protein
MTDNNFNSWTLQFGEVSALNDYMHMYTYNSILYQRVGGGTSLGAEMSCLVGDGAASSREATASSDCVDAFNGVACFGRRTIGKLVLVGSDGAG